MQLKKIVTKIVILNLLETCRVKIVFFMLLIITLTLHLHSLGSVPHPLVMPCPSQAPHLKQSLLLATTIHSDTHTHLLKTPTTSNDRILGS